MYLFMNDLLIKSDHYYYHLFFVLLLVVLLLHDFCIIITCATISIGWGYSHIVSGYLDSRGGVWQ